MRVSGLATGMDIDSIVKQYMLTQRAPLDKLSQNKQILEWRRDNYKQVNSSLVDFRQNKLGNEYRKAASMSMYSSEVTGDKEAISVRATSTSNLTQMNVKVNRLASPAMLKSASFAEGTTISSALGGLSVSATQEDGTTADQTTATGNYTLNISGKSYTFSGSDTIKNVLDKLNGDKEANVTATFDEVSRQIVIKSKTFGSNVTMSGSLNYGLKSVAEEEADVTINGSKVKFFGNMTVINGVEITLLQKSAENATSNITTKADGKKAIETIKSFIEEYNSLIKSLNSKISEKRYSDYTPLTSEQKKEMNEDDIKLWTEKAQSGLLRGDTIISEGLMDMRNILISSSVKLDNRSISLPDIGITTGTYTENGKLYLDEEKLQKAISENPDKIRELFMGSADGSTTGIFDKLYDSTLTTLGKISDKSGTSKYSSDITQALNEESTMGKELRTLNTRISELTKKMVTLETNYYNKFTAMETAINKLNSQSASITNLLSQ